MDQAATTPERTTQDRLARLGSVLFRFQSLFGLLAIVALAAVLSPSRNGANVFLEPRNLLNIVRFASENGIIAVGMMRGRLRKEFPNLTPSQLNLKLLEEISRANR